MRAEPHVNAPLKSEAVRVCYKHRYSDGKVYQVAYRQILGERYQFQILEAICRYGRLRLKEVPDAARVNSMAAYYGLRWLVCQGLVVKPGSQGSHSPWQPTERGKIVNAIMCGKAQFKRARICYGSFANT